MTKKQAIYAVINGVKQHHADSRLSKRKVFEVIDRKIKVLLDRDMRDKKLFKQNFLFKTICIDFDEVPAIECSCINLPTNCTLYKSRKKLPRLYESIFGSIVQSITTIDRSKTLYLTTAENAERKSNIRLNKDKYLFVENEYLYQINSQYPVLKLTALFNSATKNYECGCADSNNGSSCEDLLSYELVIPDRLLDGVITMSIEEILKSFAQLKYQQLNDKNSET
jgi:hypothetical protein